MSAKWGTGRWKKVTWAATVDENRVFPCRLGRPFPLPCKAQSVCRPLTRPNEIHLAVGESPPRLLGNLQFSVWSFSL